MKRLLIVTAAAALLLAGCGAQETFETVSGDCLQTSVPQPLNISLSLPDGTVISSMETEDGGKLYTCQGYEILTQTLPGGDLDRTLRQVTGYPKDRLKCMETMAGDLGRCDCVWMCAGEKGDQICRTSVFSDTNYHYAVTVMAEESCAAQLSNIFRGLSVQVTPTPDPIRTGS